MTVDTTGMTPAEKRKLLDQLAFELQGKTSAKDLSGEETALWECLNDALGISAKLRQPVGPFVKAMGAAKFKAAAAFVGAYVDEACGPALRLPMRQAMMTLVLKALAAHLAERDIPATPAVVLKSLTMLSYAVEQRFPGYAGAKLLHRALPQASCA